MARSDRLSFETALAVIRSAVPLMPEESLPAAHGQGRILAQPAHAQRDVPAFACSAMDGFAVRTADLAAGAPLTLGPGGHAGTSPAPLRVGQAQRISTGAPVPADADCVIPGEHAAIVADHVQFTRLWPAGANIRRSGEDWQAGDIVGDQGQSIGPIMIGALVASQCREVRVRQAPRIAVLATGSELADGIGGIADSNGPMLLASATALGLSAHGLGPVRDDLAAITAAISASDCDLLLSTGGVSAGEQDLVRAAFEQAGGTVRFHGVAMRPGKPLLFGTRRCGRPFFGLPGNPVAAAAGFRFFVCAALRAMLGVPVEQGEPIESAEAARPGVTLLLRARRGLGPDGRICVDTALDQRSHVLSSLLAATEWLRVDPSDGDGQYRLYPRDPHWR